MKILVTGANGFVGRGVCDLLARRGHTLVRAVRGPAASGELAVGEVNGETAWDVALQEMPRAVVPCSLRIYSL